MSSLKDSDEQTLASLDMASRGVEVASSHFSRISASNGNRGWLKNQISLEESQTKNSDEFAFGGYFDSD